MPDIPSLTALAATPADDDLLVIHDVSAPSQKDKKITVANLLASAAKVGADVSFNDVTANEISAVGLAASTTKTGNLEFTGGATVSMFKTVVDSVDLSSVAAGASKTDTIALNGIAVGDFVLWSATVALPDALVIQAYVSGANTITVRAYNPTGATITGGSYNMRFAVMRFT